MTRKNCFDFMRFVAAALVVYSHSFSLLHKMGREPFAHKSGYFSGGELGVAFFFAMSGYLVTTSLQSSPTLANFLLKRALRILPGLFVVVFLAVFVLGPWRTTLPLADYFRQPGTWSYCWNALLWVHFPLPGVFEYVPHPGSVNGSLWTLPIEAFMYLCLALLGLLGFVKKSWLPLFTLLLLLIHAGFLHQPALQQLQLWKIGLAKECVKFGIYFFAGATLYLWRDAIPWRIEIAALLLLAWIGSFGTAVSPYLMFLAIPYCTILIGRSSNALGADFGKYGDFSYGIYIYAFPVQQTLVEILGTDTDPLWLFPVALAIATSFAALSWHLIERPALQLKQRLAPAPIAIAAAPQHNS